MTIDIRLCRSLAIFSVLASTVASGAQAVPACDSRINIANPERFPFNTVATIRYDKDCQHDLKAWGTGALVGPHMLLTAGHVVYNRAKEKKNQTCNYIQPGAYHDPATNHIVYPYGERTISDTKYKKTNNKWADPTYSPERDVDYGAIRLVCPFEDIDTYIPLVFDFTPSFVNMSGYPSEDLPDSTSLGDQWRDAGDVTSVLDRQLYYDIRSTGGASGAPVWTFNSSDQTRRLIGVNAAHSTQCNGLGPRLVWQNEALILDWLSWTPSLNEKIAEGCAFQAKLIDFKNLQNSFRAGGFKNYSARELSLAPDDLRPDIGDQQTERVHKVYQYIQNTMFAWEEHWVSRDQRRGRVVRLLKPEERWLSQDEARALLSASASWMDQEPSGRFEQRGEIGDPTPLPMPREPEVPDQPSQDRTPDEAAE